MDRNTYSAAARKSLFKNRSKIPLDDRKIRVLRGRSARYELFGAISLISEHPAQEPFNRKVFINKELGLRIDIEKSDCVDFNRSCQPNVSHYPLRGKNTLVAFFPVITSPIESLAEVTLPFNDGWELSDFPLHCTIHKDELCPFEKIRLESAKMRNGSPGISQEASGFAGSAATSTTGKFDPNESKASAANTFNTAMESVELDIKENQPTVYVLDTDDCQPSTSGTAIPAEDVPSS